MLPAGATVAGRVYPPLGNRAFSRRTSKSGYAVSLIDANSPAGFHLNVKVSEAFDEWPRTSEGSYALKPNLTDWDDEKLWRAYIQLAQAEAAFRVQKTELSIRPIWHQRADRVESRCNCARSSNLRSLMHRVQRVM